MGFRFWSKQSRAPPALHRHKQELSLDRQCVLTPAAESNTIRQPCSSSGICLRRTFVRGQCEQSRLAVFSNNFGEGPNRLRTCLAREDEPRALVLGDAANPRLGGNGIKQPTANCLWGMALAAYEPGRKKLTTAAICTAWPCKIQPQCGRQVCQRSVRRITDGKITNHERM